MDIELPKLVRYIGLLLLLVGILTMGAAVNLSSPTLTVNHVAEFDQEYAEENYEVGFRLPFTDGVPENITPRDVHPTYQSENLSEETAETFRSNIGSEGSFTVNDTLVANYNGLFIVEFSDGSTHVYEGELDGIPPSRLLLMGAMITLGGLLSYYIMGRTEDNIPSDIVRSEDSRWKYEPK